RVGLRQFGDQGQVRVDGLLAHRLPVRFDPLVRLALGEGTGVAGDRLPQRGDPYRRIAGSGRGGGRVLHPPQVDVDQVPVQDVVLLRRPDIDPDTAACRGYQAE